MKFIVLALFLVSCSSYQKTTKKIPNTLNEAVSSSDYRNPENVKRDIYRHPLETLNFFGVTNKMTVVEIWPSGGWYSEILAPFLSQNGQ